MTPSRIELLGDDVPSRDFVMPGALAPVRLARLHVYPSWASVSLVRFPPGWARPTRGRYLAGEEFVVLEGSLEVSGVVYGAGEQAWIPARTFRHDCSTPVGALALAFFDGPAVWMDGEGDKPDGPATRASLATVAIPRGGLRLSPHSVLREDAGPLTTPAGVPAEVLTVGTWTWQLADPLSRDLPRDVPRDLPRDVPRDLAPDSPRDSAGVLLRDPPRVLTGGRTLIRALRAS